MTHPTSSNPETDEFAVVTFQPQWLERRKEWAALSGSERALWYVNNVLDDTLPSCLRVRQACMRFRLWQQKYEWCPDRVDWAIKCIEQFPAPENHFDLIVVTPWTAMVIAVVHGFKKPNGARALSELLLIVPRKAGKSTLTGCLLLLELMKPWGNIKSPEIALTGVNEDTSKHTLTKMRKMLHFDKKKYGMEGLQKYGFRALTREVSCARSNGRAYLLTLGSKSLDGHTVQTFVVDEVSSIPDRNGLEVLRSGMTHAKNPLAILTSTPGDLFQSALDDEMEGALRVLDGEEERPGYFPIIYRAEEEEKEQAGDPKLWERVQPHLGWSVEPSAYMEEWARMKGSEDTRHAFYTRYLCAPSRPSGIWIKPEDVEKSADPPTRLPDRSFGDRWVLGIDLSDTKDYTAIAMLGYNDRTEQAAMWFEVHAAKPILPDKTAMSREAAKLREWFDQGYLRVHPGGAIDHNIIAERLDYWCDALRPLGIYGDSYTAVIEVKRAMQPHYGARIRTQGKNATMLAEPLNILTGWVANDQIAFQKNPVFIQHLNNTVITENMHGGRLVSKPNKHSRHHIDAVDAALMAVYGYALSRDQKIAGEDNAPILLTGRLPGTNRGAAPVSLD